MSISGFMGALGDAFGGYAQAQQADERKRQMADELRFKYANLDEGIADRQARGREAIAGRQAIADENSKTRTSNAQVRADERKYEADIRASDLATQRAIAQYNATAGANKIVQVRRNAGGNDVGITAAGNTVDLGFRSPAPATRGGDPQLSANIKLLQLQQKAAAMGMSQAEKEANDYVARSGGVAPQDPGAFDPVKHGTDPKSYYAQRSKYLPLGKILSKHQTYSQQHADLTEKLQRAMAGMLSDPQSVVSQDDSTGAMPYSLDSDPDYPKFSQP